jgi:hypothetical protein
MNANWTIKLIFKRFSVNIKVSERERKEREDKKINRN